MSRSRTFWFRFFCIFVMAKIRTFGSGSSTWTFFLWRFRRIVSLAFRNFIASFTCSWFIFVLSWREAIFFFIFIGVMILWLWVSWMFIANWLRTIWPWFTVARISTIWFSIWRFFAYKIGRISQIYFIFSLYDLIWFYSF